MELTNPWEMMQSCEFKIRGTKIMESNLVNQIIQLQGVEQSKIEESRGQQNKDPSQAPCKLKEQIVHKEQAQAWGERYSVKSEDKDSSSSHQDNTMHHKKQFLAKKTYQYRQFAPEFSLCGNKQRQAGNASQANKSCWTNPYEQSKTSVSDPILIQSWRPSQTIWSMSKKQSKP